MELLIYQLLFFSVCSSLVVSDLSLSEDTEDDDDEDNNEDSEDERKSVSTKKKIFLY